MVLIADSGSTKTDWRLLEKSGKTTSYQTIGFNPYLQTTDVIAKEIQENLLSKINAEITSGKIAIHFYGSGCSTDDKKEIVAKAIRQNFQNSDVFIEHDMLAAARALCGKQPGIAAILGTGSNACLYNGTDIIESAVSLGYLLGDEGGGCHIGKTFLTAYLYNELPPPISENFYSEFKLTREDILDHLYKKPMPNTFMASFTKFIGENISDVYLKCIVKNSFNLFFEKHICKFQNHKNTQFHSVGSVGYYFKDILIESAKEKNMQTGKIISSPIDELVKYHSYK